jgi:hypothetical protein
MARRKSRIARPIADSSKFTVVIDDPVSMWAKLAWDIDIFRDVQGSYPDEKQPLAYAAVNVCIAAWSLRNWVESAATIRAKSAGLKFDREHFYHEIATAIPGQSICEAIANTAKHANLGDDRWPGGKVEMAYQEGDEDCPPGFIIYYVNEERGDANIALNSLIELCENWWTYLCQHGFAEGVNQVPEWQQNKLNRIFGRFIDRRPPTV